MSSFNDFWNLYDHKKSRDKCEKKWNLLKASDQVKIMETLPKYIKATPDRQYRKYPATYLNQRCWEDEIYEDIPIKQDGEVVYYRPSPGFKSNSEDYKPKEFQRSEFIKSLRKKLKHNYDTGARIEDWGGAISNFLTEHCGMEIFSEARREIQTQVEEEISTPPRNRFEQRPVINLEAEVRTRYLNYWLNECREKGRDLSKEI